MAKPKILPGRMDGLNLYALREEWDDMVKRHNPDEPWGMDARDDAADFVREIWPLMPEILDILDAHFNPLDGIAEK